MIAGTSVFSTCVDALGALRGARFAFDFAAGVAGVGEDQRQRRRLLLRLQVVGQEFEADVVLFAFGSLSAIAPK